MRIDLKKCIGLLIFHFCLNAMDSESNPSSFRNLTNDNPSTALIMDEEASSECCSSIGARMHSCGASLHQRKQYCLALILEMLQRCDTSVRETRQNCCTSLEETGQHCWNLPCMRTAREIVPTCCCMCCGAGCITAFTVGGPMAGIEYMRHISPSP